MYVQITVAKGQTKYRGQIEITHDFPGKVTTAW